VTISDQGSGVAEIDRDRIFEPFYRSSDDLSQLPGFGMGLAIARKLARAFGGDVALGATQAAGAQFVITLRAA
jgi:signal transduction histidine kinase